MWEKLRKVKPLHYHDKSKKKWIGQTQYQLRSHHNQPMDNDYNIPVVSTWPETNYSEIPPLESDSNEEEEGQFEDIQTYLDHHNTYQESQNIQKEYTKRLLDLDDERYYRDIDRMYKTYSQDRAHMPGTQTPAPHRTMQELIQAYGRGRGQARREQLHGH